MEKNTKLGLSGAAAGAVNGFFGAGGGTVLLPALQKSGAFREEALFPASLRIMVPVGLTSLIFSGTALPIREALPYLLGSFFGGLLAKKIRVPTPMLHRLLGLLTLIGGGRLLWS